MALMARVRPNSAASLHKTTDPGEVFVRRMSFSANTSVLDSGVSSSSMQPMLRL